MREYRQIATAEGDVSAIAQARGVRAERIESMELMGIHHHAVLVSDMERAVAFYRDVMGLQEIGIPATFPPAGARVRWFQIGDQHIHLMPAAQADPVSPRHLALAINDAQAGRAYFQSKGIATREDIPIPGADRFIIADPDGNNIELIEWQETYLIVPIGEGQPAA